MALYEHVFLARQDISSQQVDALVEQYKGIIEAAGGQIAKNEYWGVKSLAYRIRKNRKAHFTLLNLDAPSAAVVEMERQMRISEDVIRFITVRVEELEEIPSAMLQKRDRDDRGERGFERGGGGGGRFDRGGERGGDRGGERGGERFERGPRRERDADVMEEN